MSSLLETKGWSLVRVTGSHHIFVRPGSDLRITVPVHANRDLKIGLQEATMTLTGIEEKDF